VVSTMGTQATVERLKAVDLLRNCTQAQLQDVAHLAERVQVGAGEVLAREGRIGREFFLILTGSVAVTQ
jgi:CRP-like cAMP-binding protein